MFWDPQKVPVSSQIVRNIQNISTNKIMYMYKEL